MKKTLSLLLAFCMVCSIIAIVPAVKVKAYTAPVDINGNKKSSATFIIDPGHGGSDPGALSADKTRKEAHDVLRLGLAVGRLIMNSGYSVAFTRTTEFYNSPSEKAAAANSGSYSYFVSLHRNASGVGGVGYETYYYSGTTSKNLANAIHNKMVALNIWRNRGVKTAAYTVLVNTNMPAVLLEVGFIDVDSENVIFDNNFDAMALAIANGMLSMVGASVSDKTVTAPTVTVDSVVAHGSSLSVSWASVKNATSYSYSASLYEGEMSATSAKSIVSSTTTGTSFTIPAQNSGKYIKITVTAVGPENSKSTTKTVMVGPYYGSYPTDVQYIPINEINGGTSASNSTIWTSSKGSAFTAKYWRAFMCTPNSDGTYTVSTIYEYNESKSVTVSGSNILFAIHSSYANFSYSQNIVVGDILTLCGVYIDNNTIRGTGYILVNGGIPLGPDSITIKTPDISFNDQYIVGTSSGTSKDDLLAKFNEDDKYLVVKDASGAEVSSGAICTGYTVNLVVNAEVKVSYTIVVTGDVSCDGLVSTSDVLGVSYAVSGDNVLSELLTMAGDLDSSGTVSSTDYMALRGMIE